jgi:hypothetical protein
LGFPDTVFKDKHFLQLIADDCLCHCENQSPCVLHFNDHFCAVCGVVQALCSDLPQVKYLFRAIISVHTWINMPLSSSGSQRTLKHTRSITIEAFTRDDGLWDFDAHITDIKTRDGQLLSGVRPAGVPWHDLWLRFTIDTRFLILDVEAVSDWVPYPGHCQTITPDYKALVGLSIMQGFRHQLHQRMGGIAGCTHLTELAQVLPTVVIQAFAGEVVKLANSNDPKAKRPFQIDRCHAMRADGAAVAQYYPRWAINPSSGS